MSNVNPLVVIFDNFRTINRKLKRNQLPRDTGYFAGNIRYDSEYGSIVKRLSRAKYNSTTLGTDKIIAGHRYYKNSTSSVALLIQYGSEIKIGYDNLGVFSNIKTGISNELFEFLTYKNLEYMVNGSDTNIVFSLQSKTSFVENMGIPSAITPSATVSAATGNLGNGNYAWAVSLQLDSYQEGNRSPSSTALNPNGSQATIVIPTSANSRCTGRYLYRTRSGGSILYRLAAITDNSTTSYVDNIADSSLDTSILAPIDYNIPPTLKYPCLHKERIFGVDKDNESDIVYSDLRSGASYPDVFPTLNRLRISPDDGDKITAIINDNVNQLVIFKNNSIRIINTLSDSDISWGISESFSPLGCVAPRSIALTPLGAIYLTRYGEGKKRLVLWTGSGVSIIPQLEGIEPDLTAILDTTLSEVRGKYHNGYYYLAYRDPISGETFNNRVMVIDLLTWGISIDKKNIASFISWLGVSDWGELYTGTSDTTGTVYREDTDLYDLMLRYKSEIDQGSFSQAQSLGVENTPSIGLTTGVSDDIGAKTWATMTGAGTTWQALSSYNNTWWLCGEWVDAIREISAKALNTLYWNEVLPTNADIQFFIRLGDSESAVQSATWNGVYSTPAGSDISALTAAKYIQIKSKLFVKNYSDYDDIFIYRDGITDSSYAIKVSANYGNPAEATIEFDWQSGRIDLGDINEVYKRLRKRLRSVKIEYERTDTSTGNFDFYWYLNGSSTAHSSFNTSFTDFPRNRIYNFPLDNFCEDFIYRIYSNSDNKALKIKKVIFTVSVERYYAKI